MGGMVPGSDGNGREGMILNWVQDAFAERRFCSSRF